MDVYMYGKVSGLKMLLGPDIIPWLQGWLVPCIVSESINIQFTITTNLPFFKYILQEAAGEISPNNNVPVKQSVGWE